MSFSNESSEGVERLYRGCDVLTMDSSLPRAQAVSVRGDRIVAVGTVEECESALGGSREEIDLGGGTLLPGFIDTHVHPVMLAYFNMNARLTGAASIEEVQQRLGEAAASSAAGEWVIGLDFDDKALAERRMLTRHELDAAVGDVPTIVMRYDGHMLIAGTRAIEAAGVTAGSADPEGGMIDREDDGYPAGPFRETAAQLLVSAAPPPDISRFADSARATFQGLAARGITSLGAVLQTDGEGPAGAQGVLDIPAMLLVLDGIPQNIFSMLIARDFAAVDAARLTPLERDKVGGHRVGAMKIFADGSLGSSTAYMTAPFEDAPGRGFMIFSEEELYRRMSLAHDAGLQIATHAIGDAAIRSVVDLYARLQKENPRQDARHRIEHASVLDASIVEDMARLGIVAAVTPMYISSEKAWLRERLGEERARRTYPFRALLDAGVVVAGSSDAPVESTDVMKAIECCVTRDGFEPQQSIGVLEALRMYTIDAAYAQHEERDKGSVAAGKLADMVLLDADPTAVAADRISSIGIKRTIAGGATCFDAVEGAREAG